MKIRYGVLAMLLLTAAIFHVRMAVEWSSSINLDTRSAPLLELEPNAPIIRKVLDPSAQPPLFVRDEILAINGEPVQGYRDVARLLRRAKAGEQLTFHLRHHPEDGEAWENRATVIPKPFDLNSLALSPTVLNWGLVIMVPLVCWVLALGVVLARGHRPEALAMVLFLLWFAQISGFSSVNVLSWDRGWSGYAIWYSALLTHCGPVLLLWAAINWPRPLGVAKYRIVDRFLLPNLFLLGLATAAIQASTKSSYAIGALLPAPLHVLPEAYLGLMWLAMCFAVLGLLIYPRAKAKMDDRLRLRALRAGGLLAVSPILPQILLQSVTSNSVPLWFPDWLVWGSIACVCALPMTTVYAVFAEEVIPFRLFLTRLLRRKADHPAKTRLAELAAKVESADRHTFYEELAALVEQSCGGGLLAVYQRKGDEYRPVFCRGAFSEFPCLSETSPKLLSLLSGSSQRWWAESNSEFSVDVPIWGTRGLDGFLCLAGPSEEIVGADGRIMRQLTDTVKNWFSLRK